MVRLGLKPSPPHAAADVTTVVTLMTPTHADYSRGRLLWWTYLAAGGRAATSGFSANR